MKLLHLIETLENKEIRGDMTMDVRNIAFDSRNAAPGTLFVAIPGTKTDGRLFVEDAIRRGASAIMAQDDVEVSGIPLVKVRDCRKALAAIAARFYDYPAQKLKIIGVTGTNGKTTTTHLISSILEANGLKTGIMGTLYIKIPGETITARVTTPESIEIQSYLSKMNDAGVDVAIMEVSSHALHFDRVAGIKYDGAVFTNLTQDHLDFHLDLDEYFLQKKKLFDKVKDGGFALLNSDDPRTPEIIRDLNVKYDTYGIRKNPRIKATDIRYSLKDTSFVARGKEICPTGCRPSGKGKDWEIPVTMKMLGEFNVYNALAAIGTGILMNVPRELIKKGIEEIPFVRGRFQLVDEGQSFGLVVDYAHTPDGLKNILKSARAVTKNRLIVVFGCGGDRDKTKRPIMGQIAGELGDVVIVTSDNPRTEDPDAIISDIVKGVEQVKLDYHTEVDRKKAIFRAVELAGEGDMVVIAGKGHETYQIFKDKTVHFDDEETAREAIKVLV